MTNKLFHVLALLTAALSAAFTVSPASAADPPAQPATVQPRPIEPAAPPPPQQPYPGQPMYPAQPYPGQPHAQVPSAGGTFPKDSTSTKGFTCDSSWDPASPLCHQSSGAAR